MTSNFEKLRLVQLETQGIRYYQDFLKHHDPSNLLQDFTWGEAKSFMDSKVKRYVLMDNQQIRSVAQVFFTTNFLGYKVAMLPRGPVSLVREEEAFFMKHLTNLIRSNQAISFLWEPADKKKLSDTISLKENAFFQNEIAQELSFVKTLPHQPEATSVVEVQKSDENLLGCFKSKTRYNIRLAQKKGVKIDMITDKTALDLFMPLIEETQKRQGITLYDRNYFETLYKAFGAQKRIAFLFARHQGQVLAGVLLIEQGPRCIYLYGGTTSHKRELMANYSLHFAAMKFAREIGLKEYDFWGIALDGSENKDKWQGITRFKLGFQGEIYQYAPAYTRTFSPIKKTFSDLPSSFKKWWSRKKNNN